MSAPQNDELDQALRRFRDAMESDEPIDEENDELMKQEWIKFKASVDSVITAEKKKLILELIKKSQHYTADALAVDGFDPFAISVVTLQAELRKQS